MLEECAYRNWETISEISDVSDQPVCQRSLIRTFLCLVQKSMIILVEGLTFRHLIQEIFLLIISFSSLSFIVYKYFVE